MYDNKGWGLLDCLSTRTLRVLAILVLLVIGVSIARCGIIVTAENDLFGGGTDNNYSHGTEVAWSQLVVNETDIERIDIGFNQLMYTPSDITVATNCLSDRPWAGLLTVFRERWYKHNAVVTRTRFSIGVLGPSARSEQSQKIVHKIVGVNEPKGWHNQLPDEPVVQYKHTRYYPLFATGTDDEFRLVSELTAGNEFGTTFINMQGGASFKLGWVPRGHMLGGIAPKANNVNVPFVYGVAEVNGLFVLHNATLGNSYFHDMDEEERDIVPFVAEWYYGFCVGFRAVTLTYLRCDRSREFEGQPRTMDWGMVRLELNTLF